MRIAVLCGGTSSERDVSLASGATIAEVLMSAGHAVDLVDIALRPVIELRREEYDFAFLGLHGEGGEDGTVQAALSLTGIPFSGCGVTPSVLAMRKDLAKKIWRSSGIATPRGSSVASGRPDLALEIASGVGYPVIVKPASNGCSFGVRLVSCDTEIRPALQAAAPYGDTVLIEEYIDGEEYTVPLLGDRAFHPVLIIPDGRLFDHSAKFGGGSRYGFGTICDPGKRTAIQRAAIEAFHAIDGAIYARVDVMYCNRRKGPFVLEVNTIPGMTPHSIYLRALAAEGVNARCALETIIELSMSRFPESLMFPPPLRETTRCAPD